MNSVKSSDFLKVPKIVEKHFFWWKEQIILPKNIFLAQFEIVLNFHYFCKVRACRISVKNSNFQKLPKIVEKHFFDDGNKQFIQKIFLHTIWDSTKFSLFFVRSAPVEFPSKNSIFQKLPKIVEKHFLDEGNKQFIQKIFI